MKTEDFDYEDFQQKIKQYIEMSHVVTDSTNDELIGQIQTHLSNLIKITNEEYPNHYLNKFFNSAIFLRDHSPKKDEKNTDSITHQSSDIFGKKISEEEFSNRFDRLIKLLNPISKGSNLLLYTERDETPFFVNKKNNNSLLVVSKKLTEPLSFTKEYLIGILYDGLDVFHNAEYSDVIIEKILDNSIFDSFIQDMNTLLGFDHMPEARITKLEKDGKQVLERLSSIENQLNIRDEQFNSLASFIESGESIQTEYQNTKKAFEEDMKLKSAVTYWTEKAKKHSRQYKVFAFIAFILTGLLLVCVYHFLDGNFNDVVDNNATIKFFSTEIEKLTWHKLWHYGFLIFATSVALWIIRLVVKLFLSNYHMFIDAEERAVMMETYLALTKEGQGLSENDKQLVLQNLFRPTNFGIIKDESSVTITDIVSSFKK